MNSEPLSLSRPPSLPHAARVAHWQLAIDASCAIADKKAIVAVAHAILVTAYHLMARKTSYQEAGADYYERRHTDRVRRRAIETLERQGYRVVLEPAA